MYGSKYAIQKVKTNRLSGRLDSNELDIEGLKAAQRNELVVLGQKITFFPPREGLTECRQLINKEHTSRLGVPEAFLDNAYNCEFVCLIFVMTVKLKHLSLCLHKIYEFLHLKSSSYKEEEKH